VYDDKTAVLTGQARTTMRVYCPVSIYLASSTSLLSQHDLHYAVLPLEAISSQRQEHKNRT